jgi:hypothetical protein
MGEYLVAGKHEALLPSPETKGAITAEAHAEKKLNTQEASAKQLNVETVKESVEAAATIQENPFDKLAAAERATQQPTVPHTLNAELKNITLNRELQHIRRRLPRPERALSKVIHQPVIRAVSEGTSKTLTRPSGLLGGGIMAFIGTTAYVYFAKHIGVPYNYFFFTLFFIGGFLVGLVLEFIIWFSSNLPQRKGY